MTGRPAALQLLLDRAGEAIRARIGEAPAAGAFVDTMFAALARPAAASPVPVPARLPVCRHLAAGLAAASAGASAVAGLAAALAAIEPQLAWTLRAGAAASGEAFLHGHANAMIAGPGGLEPRRDIWVGVSLMAPGTTYPDHSHPPEELYVVLSPGEWRQNRGGWQSRGPGDLVHNPPAIDHAMQAGNAPLLALWLLWIGPS